MGLLSNQSAIAQAIAEKIVQPALDKRAKEAYGKILTYDAASNTATIDMYVNGQRMRQAGVNMPTNPGTIGTDPSPGDEVLISFKDDNYRRPYVVSTFDSNYQYNTGQQQQTIQQAMTPSFWGQS
jgi:hypothetical protein